MKCQKCGTEYEGAFCPNCGERSDEKLTVCPVCGKKRTANEKFCSGCGYDYQNGANKRTSKRSFAETVQKYYKPFLNIGRIVFSVLLLLCLIAPVMLHKGVNVSGSGYENAFSLYVDGVFTAVCAAVFVIAVYSLFYGVYKCVKYFAFHDAKEGISGYIADFVMSLLVLVVASIGCAHTKNWYASAGAGLCILIVIGAVGMVLAAVRFFLEKKLIREEEGSLANDSEKTATTVKKVGKAYKWTNIAVTVVLVLTLAITLIVQTFVVNPFRSSSYGSLNTRADVIKKFGLPTGAKESDLTYTYYSSEIANINRMVEGLTKAQEDQLEGDLDIDDDMTEDDLESSLEGAFGFDEIIEKLEEKIKNSGGKITVISFDEEAQDIMQAAIKSYFCQVVQAESAESGQRKLKKIDIINGYFIEYTKSSEIEYFAEYEDGSFAYNSVSLGKGSFDEEAGTIRFTDALGEYTINRDQLETVELIEDCAYVLNDTLYIVADIDENKDIRLNNYSQYQDVKKIEIKSGVKYIKGDGLSGFTSVETIKASDDLEVLSISSISGSAFYKNLANWENGTVLYIGNLMVKADSSISGDYTVKEGTLSINQGAFKNCAGLTSVTLPSGLTVIGEEAFDGCASMMSVIIPQSVETMGKNAFPSEVYAYCEMNSMPEGWDDPGFYEKVFGYSDYVTVDGIVYGIRSGKADVVKQNRRFAGEAKICSTVIVGDTEYPVTAIANEAFAFCKSLTSVVIPSGIRSIGENAFIMYGRENILEKVQIEDIASWCSIDFANINSNPLYYAKNLYLNDTLVTDLVIPDTVRSISAYAFNGCSLSSVVIPKSVTQIGAEVFLGCGDALNIYCGAEEQPSGWDQDWNKKDSRSAYEVTEWGYEYVRVDGILYGIKDDGTAILVRQSSLFSGDVRIRDTIEADGKTYSLTAISDKAFANCSSITGVYIPAGVTDVPASAFTGCDNIQTVELPTDLLSVIPKGNLRSVILNGGTTIPENALRECIYLASVTLPDGITSIGENAFAYCVSLTEIRLPATVTTVAPTAFVGCKNIRTAELPVEALSAIPKDNLRSVVLNKATEIPDNAFENCIFLMSVEIPNGVTKIGNYAFSGCVSLTDIAIPETVTSIGDYAFALTSLNEISIPDSVTGIGESAFMSCSSLEKVTIPETVTSIGQLAFAGSNSVTVYCVSDIKPSGWDTNWNAVREDVDGQQLVYTPVIWDCNNQNSDNDGIIYIVTDGLRYSLQNGTACVIEQPTDLSGSIEIPASVTYRDEEYAVTRIASSAFENCNSITSVTIPSSINEVETNAFKNCDALTIYCEADSKPADWDENWNYKNNTIPVVWNCRNNDKDEQGYSYAIIGDLRYRLKDGNANVAKQPVNISGDIVIPASVTYKDSAYTVIGMSGAFQDCIRITSVSIPDTITTIGNSAFSGCSSLTSVILPDGLTGIGNNAFESCISLTSFTIPVGVTSVGASAFRDCKSLLSVIIPDSVVWMGESDDLRNPRGSVFFGCDSLKIYCMAQSESENWHQDWNSVKTTPDTVAPVVWNDNSYYNSYIGYVYADGIVYGIKDNEACVIYQSAALSGKVVIRSSVNFEGTEYAVTQIYSEAFYNCKQLTSVVIPESVIEIGWNAFGGCDALFSAEFKNTEGWYAGSNIDADLLADPLNAAKLLVDKVGNSWEVQ